MLSPTAFSLESQTHVSLPVHLKAHTSFLFRVGSQPRILHCRNMSHSPQVPAATALPPISELGFDDVMELGEFASDSDSSAYSVEWERMEYLRTHRFSVGYLDD